MAAWQALLVNREGGARPYLKFERLELRIDALMGVQAATLFLSACMAVINVARI